MTVVPIPTPTSKPATTMRPDRYHTVPIFTPRREVYPANMISASPCNVPPNHQYAKHPSMQASHPTPKRQCMVSIARTSSRQPNASQAQTAPIDLLLVLLAQTPLLVPQALEVDSLAPWEGLDAEEVDRSLPFVRTFRLSLFAE